MKKFDNIKNKDFSAYLRLVVNDRPGILSNITSLFSLNKVSIKRLIQNPIKSKKFSSLIIITHKAKDFNLIKLVNQLNVKKYVIKKPRLIRIEKD